MSRRSVTARSQSEKRSTRLELRARSRGPARRRPRRRRRAPRRADESLGERRRVQVAGGDLGAGAGRQAPQHFVRGALAHHARAERAHLVEVVGEAGGGRLGGHERVPGGEVRLHRHASPRRRP